MQRRSRDAWNPFRIPSPACGFDDIHSRHPVRKLLRLQIRFPHMPDMCRCLLKLRGNLPATRIHDVHRLVPLDCYHAFRRHQVGTARCRRVSGFRFYSPSGCIQPVSSVKIDGPTGLLSGQYAAAGLVDRVHQGGHLAGIDAGMNPMAQVEYMAGIRAVFPHQPTRFSSHPIR